MSKSHFSLENILLPPDPETIAISRALAGEVIDNYTPKSEVLEKIHKLIQKHEKFILTTHINADADGLGSQVGLYLLLKSLHKDVVIVNSEKVTGINSFIPGNVPVLNVEELSLKEQNQIFTGRFVFILDSSELGRSGKVAEIFQSRGLEWASIDHHLLPPDLHYCVDSTYAATCELIWDLYKKLRIPISEQARIALYTGLITDTGNFRYPKTSLRTHLAGGDLLPETISSDSIYRAQYESQPPHRLKFLQRILKKVIIDPDLGYVAGSVTRKTKKGLELGDSPSEGIVNQLLALYNIHIAALMTETEDGQLKSSLRSVGDYDVSRIAAQFGGGGHKNAAGLKISKPFRKARKELLKAIEDYLKNHSKESSG